MPNDKVKITQKEIDDIYEIEKPEPQPEVDTPEEEFLTESEEAFDTTMHENLPQEDKSE